MYIFKLFKYLFVFNRARAPTKRSGILSGRCLGTHAQRKDESWKAAWKQKPAPASLGPAGQWHTSGQASKL
jgi:hypothetical protein